MVAVSSSFLLLVSLIASGVMMCGSYKLTRELHRAMCESQKVNPDIGLGITLGMTYSSVVVFTDSFCTGKYHDPIKVPNERGNTTTPSCVAFIDSGEVLIGELAKDQQNVNPRRTICGVNRLIGKKFSDDDVHAYIKTLAYKVVNKEDMPHIEVEFGNGETTKVFSVEEICSLLLGKMKEMAEAYTGKEIQRTVVAFDDQTNTTTTSVGSCFKDYRVRQSISEAGKLVGLTIADIWDCSFVGPRLARSLWSRYAGGRDYFHRMHDCGFFSSSTTSAVSFSVRKKHYIC